MGVNYVRSWSETCLVIRFSIINQLPFFNFFNHYTANAYSIVLLYTISTWRFLYRWLPSWITFLSKLLWWWLCFKTFNVKLFWNPNEQTTCKHIQSNLTTAIQFSSKHSMCRIDYWAACSIQIRAWSQNGHKNLKNGRRLNFEKKSLECPSVPLWTCHIAVTSKNSRVDSMWNTLMCGYAIQRQ